MRDILHRQEMDASEKAWLALNSDQRELIAAVFKAGRYADLEEARQALNSVINVMFDRLVNEEKAVDLGFVRLYNLPYRPDWKLLVAPTRPKRLLCFRDKFEQFKKYLMGGMGLMLDEGKIILRMIEAEPGKDWYRVTKKLEHRRLALYGKGYANEILRVIGKAMPNAIRVWKSWHDQLESASGRFFEGGRIWRVGTVPRAALRLIKSAAGRACTLRHARAIARRAKAQHKRQRDIKETVRLWELQHLQRAAAYVRQTRRHRAYLERRDRARRLLVLRAAADMGSGQSVLDGKDDGS